MSFTMEQYNEALLSVIDKNKDESLTHDGENTNR